MNKKTHIQDKTAANIESIQINEFKQDFNVSKEIRYKFGEINTPFMLIEKMLGLFDSGHFKNPNKKWLDIGTGSGYFSFILFKKLFEGLSEVIIDTKERRNHIIQNMMYMSEIRPENCIKISSLFGENCNLYCGDFLSLNISETFDFVIGNPPYNNNGLKKVPTNILSDKKTDGETVWIPFIKKSVDLLAPNGEMVVIIPSIWLKPDKAKMYDFMNSYKLEKIHCMNNTETNKIFNGYAQTPTCWFLFTKTPSLGYVTIYDKAIGGFIEWSVTARQPIPVFGASVLQKVNKYLNQETKLTVLKTNLPPSKCKLSEIQSKSFMFPNVKTCQLNKLTPELIINYSNIQLPFSDDKPKIIMAHKMYGFPYIDVSGIYGISNRDNYIIQDMSLDELERISEFLSTKTALYLFESTRYRMKCLEKYIFELIPNINKIPDFPDQITDESIAEFFGFNELERYAIQSLHKKSYNFINRMHNDQKDFQ